MEGGGPFFLAQPQYELPASGPLEQEGKGGNNVDPTNPNNNEVQQRVPGREQEQFMPVANVVRIMRRILPSNAKISDDAKETVQQCVSEFISFITNEANQRCKEEQRKTVTAEDVLWAIDNLGFDHYVGPLSLFLSYYRDNVNGNNSKASSSCVPHHVMPPQPPKVFLPPPPTSYSRSSFPESPNQIEMNGYYYGDVGYGDGSSSSGNGAHMYYGDGSSSSGSGAPIYNDPYGHLMMRHGHPQ